MMLGSRSVMPPAPSLPVLCSRTLLIVEADRSVRLFLERALRQTGAVVVVAEDAEAALTVLTLVRPDLILMDLALPGLSGLNLARRLRADHARRGIKLVALSRLCGPILTETVGAAGFDAHVETPMTVAELGAVLRRLLPEEEGREPEGVR
jgi:CheY-like chemotaxis protein